MWNLCILELCSCLPLLVTQATDFHSISSFFWTTVSLMKESLLSNDFKSVVKKEKNRKHERAFRKKCKVIDFNSFCTLLFGRNSLAIAVNFDISVEEYFIKFTLDSRGVSSKETRVRNERHQQKDKKQFKEKSNCKDILPQCTFFFFLLLKCNKHDRPVQVLRNPVLINELQVKQTCDVTVLGVNNFVKSQQSTCLFNLDNNFVVLEDKKGVDGCRKEIRWMNWRTVREVFFKISPETFPHLRNCDGRRK